MGLHITLSFHQIDDGTEFDVEAANKELLADTAFGELYEHLLDGHAKWKSFEGPFRYNEGELQIANNSDGYFEGYTSYTTVWGCYGPKEFNTIAKHITKGKIVFFVEIEGNPNEFYICTPGNVDKKLESELTF